MLRFLLVLMTIFLLPAAPVKKPTKPTPGQKPLAGILSCEEDHWPPYLCPPDCGCQ